MPRRSKFEVYRDNGGGSRWRLKATNGETVATGESFMSKPAALKGAEAVRKLAQAAVVVDLTGGA